jgi:hypothetical protein
MSASSAFASHSHPTHRHGGTRTQVPTQQAHTLRPPCNVAYHNHPSLHLLLHKRQSFSTGECGVCGYAVGAVAVDGETEEGVGEEECAGFEGGGGEVGVGLVFTVHPAVYVAEEVGEEKLKVVRLYD